MSTLIYARDQRVGAEVRGGWFIIASINFAEGEIDYFRDKEDRLCVRLTARGVNNWAEVHFESMVKVAEVMSSSFGCSAEQIVEIVRDYAPAQTLADAKTRASRRLESYGVSFRIKPNAISGDIIIETRGWPSLQVKRQVEGNALPHRIRWSRAR